MCIRDRNYASTVKTAGEHISDAMTHSTDLWYYINSLSVSSATDYPRYFPEKPSAEIVQTYGDFLKAEYQKAKTLDDQIEIIMQQKYIHLNLMAPNECWTELRRTRHPKLEPDVYKRQNPDKLKKLILFLLIIFIFHYNYS